MVSAIKRPNHSNEHSKADDVQRGSASTTVAKAMTIVELLAAKAETGVGLSELSALVDMPKSSAHRYLTTLQSVGLVERTGKTVRLGTRVIELADPSCPQRLQAARASPVMDELAEMTGETIHLAVPSATDVVYIAKIESKHTLGMSSHIGTRVPMYCTSLGKAILAFNDPELVEAVLVRGTEARTPNTITSNEALRAELFTVHSQGFALDNEENELGICCLGAPILITPGRRSPSAYRAPVIAWTAPGLSNWVPALGTHSAHLTPQRYSRQLPGSNEQNQAA
jgi:DNA-binding IclR family transcriptional regulator